MEQVSELRDSLSYFLDWNKARLECLAQILRALLQVRTVNLTQIAAAFQTGVKEESCYRRVCRFFTCFSFDMSVIAVMVVKLFLREGKWLLILDRTNWKWGKTPINILMLSVAYKGISLPLFWTVLDLEGNSSTGERISILKGILEKFGVDKIRAFTADREFVGKEWFEFLIESQIPFIIRVKGCYKADGIEEEQKIRIDTLCKGLGRKQILNRKITLWGLTLYVSIEKRKGAKEHMIVISNRVFDNALELYRMRWQIETMFGCLKTRGFRMEDTHMTDADKIEKLMFVLAIAFCWSYRIGDNKEKETPTPVKSHGRPAKSLFRKGLDEIRQAIFRSRLPVEFRELLKCFMCLKTEGFVS